MATCFVMQPFDGGAFDDRFESIFEPAIVAADLDAYRVDRDPSASIPIEDIERGIRESQLCLADITMDNPNVWFELGYAIACKKDVVLVCSDERTTKFPFDVQHRSIIKYGTKSPQEYNLLRDAITKRIGALLKKAETLHAVAVSPVASIQGLDHHEVVCLAAIASNGEEQFDYVASWRIKNDMEKNGTTKIAASIALASLQTKKMIDSTRIEDRDYEAGSYVAFQLTPLGWNWILTNREQFTLKKPDPKPGDFDDDIPF